MNLEQLLRSRGARRELRTMSVLGQKLTSGQPARWSALCQKQTWLTL